MIAFRWTRRRLHRALGFEAPRDDAPLGRVWTDSRTLEPGDVFVALRGPRFDGHDYAQDALSRGAGAVVAQRRLSGASAAPVPVLSVPSTLRALGDLARYRRDRFEGEVVGITGSCGKTTVKDMLLSAIGEPGREWAWATPDNHNNRVGVPAAILSAPNDRGALILEMGTNERGEIAELARIARPRIGCISTASESHALGLGDFEGVLEEKLDLARAVAKEPGGEVVTGDSPPELLRAARAILPGAAACGLGPEASLSGRPDDAPLQTREGYRFKWQGVEADVRAPGPHHVQNALLALTLAARLNVPPALAARGLSNWRPRAMRCEVERLGRATLLIDCYNANPQSARAALQALEELPETGRKLAVLGGMRELGPREEALHLELLADARRRDIDLIVLVGRFARLVKGSAGASNGRVRLAPSVASLAKAARELFQPGDAVLLKASRSERLERLLPALRSRYSEGAA